MKSNNSGGTMKPNKSSDPTTPYARRQSIISRVTDSVKDMLSPSWLLDLVNSVQKKSPPSSQENSSQWQGREIQHSMQTNIQGIVTQAHPHTNDIQNNRPSPPRPMMTPYSSHMEIPVSHEQHISHYSHTAPTPYIYQNMKVPHMNGIDDHSEHSEYSVSTSGCSPLLPNTDRSNYQQEQMLHMNDMRSNSNPRESLPQPDANQTGESSYLWSSEVNSKVRKRSQPQTPAKRAKPSFDMTSFGNLSSFGNSKLGSGYQESPYYPGKTTFGGASSQRKSRLNSSAPYKMTPTRKEVKAKPSKVNDISGVTSTTAKMILDTLERLSTPINDAKKVPSYKSSQNTSGSPFSMSPFTYSKRGATPRRLSQGPPVKQLVTSTPTIPTLNLNRQTPTSANISLISQTENKNAGNQQKQQKQAEESSSKENIGNADSALGVKAGAGKMKRKKESHHFSSKKEEEEEEVEVPNLPTEVTLSINNMPKFNFGTSPSKGSSSTTSNAVSSPSFGASSFSFASPIPKSPTGATLSPVQNQGKFQFSSPTYLDQKQTLGSTSKPVFSMPKPIDNEFGMLNKTNDTPKSSLDLKFKSPVGATSQNDEGGFKPAAKLKTGSVLEALGKGNKIAFGQGLKPSTELKSGSVLDVIKGSKSENKEVTNLFGKSVKPTDKKDDASAKGTEKAADKPLSSLFSKPAGSWNCDVCMITNKSDIDKCVACQSPKPVEKKPPSSQVAPGSQKDLPSIASMFKAPAGNWSCPTCMIQNKSELAKCVACETPKPSSGPPPSQPSLANAFKKSSDSWDCPTCLINNKAEIDKCVACQTAKPSPDKPKVASGFGNLVTKPAGTWECPTCLIQNKPDKSKCAACETPKPGSSQNSTTAVIPSIFGNIKKQTEKNWECETCMVSNKPESSRCVACDYLKPGSNPPATGFTNNTGFKFAASGGFKIETTKSETSSTSSVFNASSLSSAPKSLGSGFKMPGSTDSGTAATPSSGFAFKPPSSSGKQEKSKESETKGGFSFNKSASETKQSESLVSKESPKQIPFGGFMAKPNTAKNESEELKVVTNLDSTKSVTSSLKDTPAPVGGFGFQPPKDDKKSTSGFSFGKEETSSKPTGGFSFGAKKDDTKTPTPVGSLFGTTKDDTKTTAPAGGFSFGTPKEETKTVSGGFSFGSTKDKSASVEAPSKNVFSFTANNQTKTEGEKTVTKNVLSLGSTQENSQKTPATEAIKPFGSGGSFDFKNPVESQTNGTKPSTGGFSFTGKSEPPKTSLAGGPIQGGVFGNKDETEKGSSLFTFGASKPKDGASTVFGKSLGSSKPEASQQPAMPAVKSNAGGFGSFASLPTNNLTSSTNEKPQFGFNKPAENKTTPSSSPFTFGQPVAGANTSKALGTGSSSGLFGASTPNSGPGLAFGAKRGIGEDEGPSAKKKTGVTEEKPNPFNFGGSSTTPGNFSFTGKSAAPATSGSSSVFQFGKTSAPSNDKPLGTGSNNAFGGFGSGSTGPAFGQTQNNNVAKITPFGGEANKQSPFGTPAQGTVPGFGSSAASSAQPFGSGNMNAGTAPTSGFNFSNAATPNLQFNQTPQANQGSVYKFGPTNAGSNNNANASSSPGVFQFGQTQPAGTNSFNMGGSAPANAFPMQNSAAPSNPFNAVGSGGQPGSAPRKIRKAVRKLKK